MSYLVVLHVDSPTVLALSTNGSIHHRIASSSECYLTEYSLGTGRQASLSAPAAADLTGGIWRISGFQIASREPLISVF